MTFESPANNVCTYARDPQKVLYEDAECSYYTTLEMTKVEQLMEITLSVHRGMLDLAHQYYDYRG